MFRPKILLLAVLLLLSFTWLFTSGWKKNKVMISGAAPAKHMLTDRLQAELRTKASEAKIFARKKGFNEGLCFLVNMRLPSGQNRFFVYDMEKDSLELSGLVAHGRCNQNWLDGRKYDNTVGCGCTSLGRYKVGYPYNGRFGEAFKLYGLDKTNDNAFARFVVLHSYECVPSMETSDEICQSDGCPMVAPSFLNQLKPFIRGSKKPLLLWIYE